MTVPSIMFMFTYELPAHDVSRHIRSSTDPLERNEDDLEKLIYDENYQKEFHKRIVFCIEREITFTE